MRRRNPPRAHPRRRTGPPPWPDRTLIALARKILVARRGCLFDAPEAVVEDLRRRRAWLDNRDPRACSDAEIVWLMIDDRLTPPR